MNRYRARLENSDGHRWSVWATSAADAVRIADARHAEIVWLRRIVK